MGPFGVDPRAKRVRVITANALLMRYKTDPRMLDWVVAIGETWIRYQPTKKSQSMEWHRHGESR